VVYDQGILFVADIGGTLHIVSAMPGEKLKLLGSMPVPKPVLDLDVSNGFVFLACGSVGTFVVDIRRPGQPVMVGKIDLPEYLLPFAIANSLAVSGQYLYIANGQAGVQFFDLNDPGRPVYKGGLNTLGNTMSLAIAEDRVYVADVRGGLSVLDSQSPDRLQVLGSLGFNIKANGMMVVGDELFAVTNLGGVLALPLPFRISRMEGDGSGRVKFSVSPLAKAGSYSLFLADGEKNLILPDAIRID
jgi:hypothetical protein